MTGVDMEERDQLGQSEGEVRVENEDVVVVERPGDLVAGIVVSGSGEYRGVGLIEEDLAAMEKLFSAKDAPRSIVEALEREPFREAIPRALDCVLEALDRAKELLVDPSELAGDADPADDGGSAGGGESTRVDDDAACASPASIGLLAGAVRLACLLGRLIEYDCEDLATGLDAACEGEGPVGGARGGRVSPSRSISGTRVSRSVDTSAACEVVRVAEELERSIRDTFPERGAVPRAYWPPKGSWEGGPWLPATEEEVDAIAWWFVRDPRQRRQLEGKRVFLGRCDLAAVQAAFAAERGAGAPPSDHFLLRRDAEAFAERGLWAILPWQMALCKWRDLGRAAVRVWAPLPEEMP